MNKTSSQWYTSWFDGGHATVTFAAKDGKDAFAKAERIWGRKGSNVQLSNAPNRQS